MTVCKKHISEFRLRLIAFFLLVPVLVYGQKIKVACLGSGTMYGVGLNKPELYAYPSQLQRLLGEVYEIKNFSLPEATVLEGTGKSYRESEEFKQASAYQPDFVLVHLGTDDAKPEYKGYLDQFEENYKQLLSHFNQPSAFYRIILIIPEFTDDDEMNKTIKETIIPGIEKVAFEKEYEIIDLHSILTHKKSPDFENGRITSLGSTSMSRTIYETLSYKSEHDFNVLYDLSVRGEESNFHGYRQMDFDMYGWKCKLVRPKRTAIGRPWLWRARFWGEDPTVEKALLQRGFHIAYIDVVDLYGSYDALERWNRFYDLLKLGGMALKPVLMGVERGGLVVFNWLAANQDKVSCVFADSPVLDLRSWPEGSGKGKGSPEDWEKVKKLYKLNNEKKLAAFRGSPSDKADIIVKSDIPIMLVTGDEDDLIPYEENGMVLTKGNAKSRGKIQATIVKGGHISHSYYYTKEIVEFILTNTGYSTNFAVLSIAGAEYRQGAGWIAGVDWWDNHMEIADNLAKVKPEILFLGNSITQGIGGRRKKVSYQPGYDVFKEKISGHTWENAGISGDRVENVYFRFEEGHYERSKARLIVLTIGVNNFTIETPEQIAEGITRLVNLIEDKMPDCKILLLGPLPAGLSADSTLREQFEKTHEVLGGVPWGDFVTYRKYSEPFYNPDKTLNLKYFAKDGIHLTPEGYEKWAELLEFEIYTVLE